MKDNAAPAAFMGKMTAGVTHELRNVLAIIRESAGLIDDLMSFSKGAAFPSEEKVRRALARISEQVDRGTVLAGVLNRFAHSPDQARAEVDLNQTIELVTALTRRFTRMKGVALETFPSELPVMVTTDPFGITMFLHCLIEGLAQVTAQGVTLTLRASRSPEGKALVDISAGAADATIRDALTSLQDDEAWKAVLSLAETLNSSLVRGAPAACCRVVIGKL